MAIRLKAGAAPRAGLTAGAAAGAAAPELPNRSMIEADWLLPLVDVVVGAAAAAAGAEVAAAGAASDTGELRNGLVFWCSSCSASGRRTYRTDNVSVRVRYPLQTDPALIRLAV